MGSASRFVKRLRRIPLWLWFVGIGALEMAIALIAAYVLHAPPQILRILLPTLVLFFDPSPPTVMTLVAEAVILFGGSFAIWGMIGLALGALIRWSGSPE